MSQYLHMSDADVAVSFRTDLDIDQVAPIWLTLESQAKASFFLSWCWVGCWLRQTGLVPNLLIAERNGVVIGLALLQPGTCPSLPHWSGRYLTSSGDPAFDSVFVEYNGFLAAIDQGEAVGRAFQGFLAGRPRAGGWSRLHLPGVTDAMSALWLDSRFVVRSEISRAAPTILLHALRSSQTGYIDGLSRNCRYQIRRSMRLYRTDGPLTLEIAATLAEAGNFFDELRDLHQFSWRQRGQPGAFAIPFFERFHRALLEEAWPKGHIDLLRLRVGPTVIGCLYNFHYGGDAYAYQSGFRFDADPRRKPGLVMQAMATERYLGLGVARYRLLAGDSRTKTSLANAEDRLHWLVVRRPGWRAACEDGLERAGRRLSAIGRNQTVADRIADQTGNLVNIEPLH